MNCPQVIGRPSHSLERFVKYVGSASSAVPSGLKTWMWWLSYVPTI